MKKHSRKQLLAAVVAAGLAVTGISAAEHPVPATAQIGYVLSDDYGVPFNKAQSWGRSISSFFCRRTRACVNLGNA